MQLFPFHANEEVRLAGGNVGGLVEYYEIAGNLADIVRLTVRDKLEFGKCRVPLNFNRVGSMHSFGKPPTIAS